VGATLGRACIVNTAASIDHDCRLGEGVHVCPGAHVAGEVVIERFVMIGTGASVVPRVTIGEGAVVGAGAVVIEDVPPHTTVAGVPARKIIGSCGRG
jgi:acetyltransferase-like isoleucine patch superfamily enzyme